MDASVEQAALFAEPRLPLQQGLPEYRVSLALFEHRLVLTERKLASEAATTSHG